jgi:hypothetical protein
VRAESLSQKEEILAEIGARGGVLTESGNPATKVICF